MFKSFRYIVVLIICLLPLMAVTQDVFPKLSIKNYGYDYKNSGVYICAISPYLVILNDEGYPIFYREIEGGARNFKKQDNGCLTFYCNAKNCFYTLDSLLTIVDTLAVKGDYITDYHYLKIFNDKNYLLGYEYMTYDMSEIVPGGQQFATIKNSILQVQDKDKNILLNWESIDHVDIMEAHEVFVDFESNTIDFFHPNAIDVDTSDNIYVSSRHLNQILKIDAVSGDIIWRLGGERNEFQLVNDVTFFSGQHSIKITSDSLLYLFDNGNVYHPSYSEGKVYHLHEGSKTVELLNKIGGEDYVFTSSMGNFHVDSYNQYLIGWGKSNSNLLFSEYDNNGNLTRKVHFDDGIDFSYAVNKIQYENKLFSISEDTLVYATVNYGNTKTLKFSIKNNLSSVVAFDNYYVNDTNFTVINSFPITIKPYEEAEIYVKYTPTKYEGEHQSTLYLNSYSDSIYTQKICAFNKLIAYSEDIVGPEISIIPENNSENIEIESHLIINSDEPLRLLNDSVLTVEDLKNIIELKDGSSDSIPVDFNVQISPTYDEITISPESLAINKEYCIIINDSIEDNSDNKIQKIKSCFTTEGTTSVVNLSTNQTVIYPNPCKDILNIKGNKEIELIEIYNVQGSCVLKKYLGYNVKSYSINIPDFSKGIYFIRILYKDFSFYNTQFIKN